MDIHVDIEGALEVGLRFENFPDDLRQALRDEIEALGNELFARVEAATPARTGRLRSQERLSVTVNQDRIEAEVTIAGSGKDLAKAGALEYGAHRPKLVKEHNMRLDHHWALKLAAPEMVLVAAYTRTPNIAEVAFERGPLAEMAPEILARLNAIVGATVAKVNS